MLIHDFGWRKSTGFVLVLLLGFSLTTHLAAQVDMGSISGVIRGPIRRSHTQCEGRADE